MQKKTMMMTTGILFLILGTCVNVSTGNTSTSTRTPTTVIAGSSTGNFYVYNEWGDLKWSYNTGADVVSVAVSSDGKYIAVGSLGSKLYLFTHDGRKLWEKNVPIAFGGAGNGGESKSVAISAHGEYIVAGCTDNLHVFKKNGALHWSHSGSETCVGISANAAYVVACNRYDGTIDFFWISSSTPLWTKSIGASWVATSNPGNVVASTFGTAHMFNKAGTQLWSYVLDIGGIVRVDMPDDGLTAIVANDDPGDVACYIWYFDLSGLVWKYTPCPPEHDFYSVSISSDGNVISMGPGNIGGIFVYSRYGTELQRMPQSSWVQSVDLTSDGRFGVWGDRTLGTVWFFSKESNVPLWSRTVGGMVKAVAIAYHGSDWPMRGCDAACTGYSSSTAPNGNATAWVTNLPGGTAWAYPLVEERKVFIGAGGYLNAFNETDGSPLWSFAASGQPGYPATSAVADGRVFFGTAEPGPGGCIYALNATTGLQIWNFTTEGYMRAPPVVSENRLYFGGDLDGTGKVYCINATSGASIWNYTTQDRMTSVAVAYGRVYASCGHWETDTQAAVYCLDMYDGTYVWSFDTGKDIGGYLAAANGKVYFTASYEGWDCVVYALNATNGDVVWTTTRYSDGNAGGVAVAYGKVFIAFGYYRDGIYALNETNGDEIWAFPTVSGPGGGPVVADGKVFFSGGYPSHMFYAVNETNGAIIWSNQFAGDVHSSSSAIADGMVFVADHWDAMLYAFWSYEAIVNAYCNREATSVSVSITKDGSPTGYYTPHTFTNLNSTYTFTVPDNDPSGHPFLRWNTGSTSTTITVSSGGTYTAYYESYDVTIDAYCTTEATGVSVSITKDGSPTGYCTPHTFTNLNGIHTFTVPDNDPTGHQFRQWNTGSTSTTITVSSGGTYTAYYTARHTLAIIAAGGGTTNPSPGTYTYWAGETTSYILASPSTGYAFAYWTLDGLNIGSANPIKITMDNNHTLKAFFVPTGPIVAPGGDGMNKVC